jgi:hypothetical protein
MRATDLSRLALIAACGLYGASAFADEKPQDKPQLTPEQMQMKVYETISRSAGAIDQCTQAYLTEYPAANGNVELTAVIVKDGSVGQATASTQLEGARNLRPCLEKVPKGWKFFPIGSDSEKLVVVVHVKKGQKFVLRKPGEEAKPRPGEGPQEEGFIGFMPNFLPGGWAENPK